MKKDIKNLRLSDREEEVMSVLWDAENELTVTEIFAILYEEDRSISVSSINTALNVLLSKELVEIVSIEKRARLIKATISADEYALLQYQYFQEKKRGAVNVPDMVAALISTEKNEDALIDELEAMLQSRRAELKGK